MKKLNPDNLHLSLRKRTELQRMVKERKELDARIAMFTEIGETSTEDTAAKIAEKIVHDMQKVGKAAVPETIQRKALKLAYAAIPKSNRGRKPAHQAA